MTANPDASAPSPSPRRARGWPWALLVLAIGLVALIRVPLVLNAGAHLDSDLAVDGLALIDALDGHWRWHYPATPFIGSPPVLLSWVQAKVWGPTPIALASGGVVAYGLVVVATFLLNRRPFGDAVASWGLVPQVFASTGTLWLSGRVTGGHLLAVAWHAGAFLLLWDALVKGGWRRSATLGLWCGLGLYVDSMFAVTWVGLGVTVLVRAFSPLAVVDGATGLPSSPLPPGEGPVVRVVASPAAREMGSRAGHPAGGSGALVCTLAFALAAGLGLAPRVVGRWVDPHDAYVGQFEPVTRLEVVARNARILRLDCAPRLIAGHRLPRLQAEPDPASLPGASRVTPEKGIPWLGMLVAVASLGLFAWSMVGLVVGGPDVAGGATTLTPALSRGEREAEKQTRVAIRWGLLASSLAVVAGFLVHPTITNSDNYRYLVTWLVPGSTGFGLAMARVASRRSGGAWLAGALALGFAGLMTADSARWYGRFGWLDPGGRPIRKVVDDPVRGWLDDHPRVSVIWGSYWDVYRLSFLTGGRVRGVPFGEYPQRFPEIQAKLPPSSHRAIIVRPDGVGPAYRNRALARGAREIGRGEGFSIVEWPEGMTP